MIRIFFGKLEQLLLCYCYYLTNYSSEAASTNQSVKDEASDKMSSFDESESSCSKEVDGGREQLWSGHLSQHAQNCSVVMTVDDPIMLNVSDQALESVKSVFKHNKFKKSSSTLVNQLGHNGDIVYTEIKVIVNILPRYV